MLASSDAVEVSVKCDRNMYHMQRVLDNVQELKLAYIARRRICGCCRRGPVMTNGKAKAHQRNCMFDNAY